MAGEVSVVSRFRLLSVVAIILVALGLRIVDLDLRPVHHDEANQAVRCGRLLEEGRYTYDLHDHHGPTLYYLAWPLVRLQGATLAETTITAFRLLPALLGFVLVLLPLLMRGGVGRREALWAAGFAAVSPALVFYSRFFIQETLFVCFTAAFLCGLWRCIDGGGLSWAIFAGVNLGLLHATKETSILVLAAVGAAGLATLVWHRHLPRGEERRRWRVYGATMVLSAAAVSSLLYSSFLANPVGPVDAVRAYGVHAWRGSAAGDHVHPWYYYLNILMFWRSGHGPVWSEGAIVLLAAIGAARSLFGGCQNRAWGRFVALYVLILVVLYSAISYKTPWNVLPVLHGMTILAGIGAVTLIEMTRRRRVRHAFVLVVLAAGLAHLGWQAWRASFRMPADPANPYVYAHTSKDFLGLVERLEGVAGVAGEGRGVRIDVVTNPTDAWPLPWYLRRFTQVGYFDPQHVPEEKGLPVVISSADASDALMQYLGEGYISELRQLRPEIFLTLSVREDLWEAYVMAKTSKPRDEN